MSTIAPIEPSAQGTTAKHVRLGTRYEDPFGRVFYYAYGASAVGRGKLGIAAAAVGANHEDLSFQTAPAVGDKVVKVTLGGTAVTADQYADGWLTVQDGTGEGRSYPVEGNDAQTSTTGTAVFYLGEPIDTAGALSEDNVDLNYNYYDNVRPVPDNAQAYVALGVPICVGGLGASEHAYLQSWGPCAIWRDETDDGLVPFTFGAGTGTGQIEGKDGAAEPQLGMLGPSAGVDTEYQMVYLQINR